MTICSSKKKFELYFECTAIKELYLDSMVIEKDVCREKKAYNKIYEGDIRKKWKKDHEKLRVPKNTTYFNGVEMQSFLLRFQNLL